MTVKHTEGPWKSAYLGESFFREEIVLDSNCGLVCSIVDKGKVGKSKANLIAAAPELLAALEAVLAYEQDVDNGPWPLAVAAIAKAKGES